ncbi:nuclear transport factor 2 family protein [Mucilaginibacter sp. Bleaf8]|uniref:nuclear transport factor 2 family protein n=1 Tax=Mucilaginibacter sp. Bleaf8 TaxID=2834430 RepID=UPI001BCE6078|nr:nuclear transport factor 2 family protein [Mucilaginibacter sp. Bleaf8]MBS7564476.1 nuclear transport factor 2 family protein [Mucilaginibacter sp. Bleaf8]
MKKYLFLLPAALLMACQQQPASITENNTSKATIQALFDAFNRHDWKKMASYYADTTLMLDPEYGTAYVKKSQQDIIATHQNLQKFSPDVRDSITSLTMAGNTAVAEFVSSGTTADGTKWTLPICSVITFKDGKIIKDATYYDK